MRRDRLGQRRINADLLPGVKVNAGALLRLVQLAQERYALLHP